MKKKKTCRRWAIWSGAATDLIGLSIIPATETPSAPYLNGQRHKRAQVRTQMAHTRARHITEQCERRLSHIRHWMRGRAMQQCERVVAGAAARGHNQRFDWRGGGVKKTEKSGERKNKKSG